MKNLAIPSIPFLPTLPTLPSVWSFWSVLPRPLLAALCLLLPASLPAADTVPPPPPVSRITLSGDTNKPEMSMYIPGETITLTFTVTGLVPTDRDLLLNLVTTDARGVELERQPVNVPADQGATWKTEITAAVRGLGFYRVYASLSNGVTLPELGSRAAGYLTYAIVPDPATRKLYPEEQTYFGMQGGFNSRVNVLPLLGVRFVLDGQFGWDRTEPERAGQFLAKQTEANAAGKAFPARAETETWTFCKFKVNGIDTPWQVYPISTGWVIPAPKWAQKNPANYPKQGPLSPEGEKAFRDYCLAAGKAYAALYPDRPRHTFEITWEPCVPWNFIGTIAEVVRLYEIAYPALHEADPKAFVIGPCAAGISNGGQQELEEFLKCGVGKYIDGYSVHPYHAQPCEQEGIIRHVRATKELLRKYIGRDLPLFGTEMGYSHQGTPGIDLEHARCATRENLILFGEGFQFNFAFYIHDTGTRLQNDGGYGYFYGLTPGSVCGTCKTGPKPAAPAYAAMSWLLEGHHPVSAIEWLGDTAWGYAYENADDIVLALWDFGDAPRQVTIPVGSTQVEQFDWMGNGKTVTTPGGNLALTLTQEPVYVRGVAPALWGKNAVKAVTLTKERMTAFPGREIRIAGTLRPPEAGKPFNGTLVLEADRRISQVEMTQAVQLKASREKTFEFRLTLPPELAPGSYPIKLVLENDKARAVAAAGLRLELTPPLSLEKIVPAMTGNGAKSVVVTLRDAAGEGAAGTVSVQLAGVPESRKSVPFKLPPGGTMSLPVVYPQLEVSPFQIYAASVTAATAGGYSFSRECNLNFLAATKLAAPPKIDGDLSDWAKVPGLPLKGLANVVRSPNYYTGEADEAVVLRFAWDEKSLYLGVEVTDDVWEQRHTGNMVWQGDCLQFGFNPDHGRQFELSGNGLADAALQPRATEMALALTKDGPQAYRHMTFNPAKLKAAQLTQQEVLLAVVWKDGKLTYEAAIPWKELGYDAAPRDGDILGLGMSANDSDDPKQPDPSALGIFQLKKIDGFGMLILGGTLQ